MTLYGWFVVILVTSAAVLLGVGWLMEHADRKFERARLLGELDQATANVQLPKLPHAGYLPGPRFAGAQDSGVYEVRAGSPIPWDLAGAAYELGQQRASADEITRQVDAIMAEVEANPDRWERR